MQVALTAVRLCVDYRVNFDNFAASNGWLARVDRLVDGYGLEPRQVWVLLMRRTGSHGLNDRTEQKGFTVGYDIEIIGSRVRVLVGIGASLATITTDVIDNRPPLAFRADKGIHG